MTTVPSPYLSPSVGDRVVCTLSPNADGSLEAGTVAFVLRQHYTDDLVRVDWDRYAADGDYYTVAVLEREGWKP